MPNETTPNDLGEVAVGDGSKQIPVTDDKETQPAPGAVMPTPAQVALAESMMNPAQKAATEFREKNLEELKSIQKIDRLETYYWRPASGQLQGGIAGRFDDRQIQVEGYSWGDADSMEFSGKIDGLEVSPEEAKALWGRLKPLVDLYFEYQKVILEAVDQAEEDVKNEAKRREIAGLQEVAKTENAVFNGHRAMLNKSFEKMAIEENSPDYEFLKKSINKIAMIIALEPGEGPYGGDEILSRHVYYGDGDTDEGIEKIKEHSRRVDLLYKLLGIDQEEGQKWFGTAWGTDIPYLDSTVYPTIFEGVALRHRYGHRPHTKPDELILEKQTSAETENVPEENAA
ncbi:hypothetical protein A3A68_01570 [Candidatus Saccharibacteria bacterium RIFCSPLOWO2_01_FULL_48_13]|nr:MAG: hypothetical protein A3F38_00140 [Candidatus Saccharibacteria bacterium RIFCSPHIGHO2_12_FULL_48_21]OGL37437.1 MAG: hypothetical protein A3A68_01570 [Candidatus Saccharibacteria bacterium RIFCSPLOWO2_01_FULL_48_13]